MGGGGAKRLPPPPPSTPDQLGTPRSYPPLPLATPNLGNWHLGFGRGMVHFQRVPSVFTPVSRGATFEGGFHRCTALDKNPLDSKVSLQPSPPEMNKYKSIYVNNVVVIDDWYSLDESLVGSRVKQTFADPETDSLYIFKEPNHRRDALIWSELIASFICGDLLDWPVQHAQIATRDGRVGNLLKYIFDPHHQTLIAGELLCKHYDPEFDPKQGRRHTWPLIRKIHEEFFGEKFVHTGSQYVTYWARAVAFDTLISNSDRHAENWSFILANDLENAPDEIKGGSLMAPFYDNGTSMGCEVDSVGLKRWFDNNGEVIISKLQAYTNRGCHHLRDGFNRYPFTELTRVVLSEFSDTRSEFEAVAGLDLSRLDPVFEDIMHLSELPEAFKMTAQRRVQITRLLQEGQARVIRALEESE